MLKKVLAGVGLLACCAGQALAGSVGAVSDYFTGAPFNGSPSRPAIATSPRGDSAVTWAATGADGTLDIFLSLPIPGDPYGSAMGPPVRVNTSTYGHQRSPSIAMDATGDFVIVWQTEMQPGDPAPQEIHGQRFTAGGFPIGQEFKVNLRITQTHTAPAVAMDAAGNFVVVWLQIGPADPEVRSVIFNADGQVVRNGFFATDAADHPPAIAMGAHGEYVIAWKTAAGQLAMKQVPANHDTNLAYTAVAPGSQVQSFPAVGTDAHGRYVIAWNDTDPSGGVSIRARRFLANGTAAGEAFVVNEASTVDQNSAVKVAADASGDFAIVWDGAERSSPNELHEWFIQMFGQDGARASPETNGAFVPSFLPALAVDADGDAYVPVVDVSGSPGAVGMFRFTGPESIDLGITLADDVDPARPGGNVNVTFDVTNHNAPSAETGIADVDSAIGVADAVAVRLRFNGLTAQLPPQCSEQLVFVRCNVGLLAPGESTATTVPAVAQATAGLASTDADIFNNHFDGGTAADAATETTAICEPGDSAGTVVISAAPTSITEGDTAYVEVTRVGGSCGAVSVYHQRTNDAPGVVSWDDGAGGVRAVPVTITRDGIDLSGGSVTLTLTEVTGGAVLGDPSSVTIEGEDVDPTPVLTIQTLDGTATEGMTLAFHISLSNQSAVDITVPLEWSGSATLGDDFTAPTMVTIPALDPSTFVLTPIRADGVREGEETAIVSLGPPTNAVLGDDTSYTLTIAPSACQGQPAGSIVISSAPATVDEGNSAELLVQRVNGTCGEVSVRYESSYGPDNAQASGTLIWADGESASRTISILSSEDGIDEDPQPIDLALSSPTGGATLGSPSSATIMIIDDDDPPRVQLSRTQDGGFSEGGVATFILTLSEPNEKDVIVPFTISGTAGAADYSVSEPSGQVHFAAGGGWNDITKQVHLTLLRDDTFEGDEALTVTLGEPTNARLTETISWTFTIGDLDSMPFVSIDAPDGIAQEGTSRSVNVNAWPKSTRPITIPLAWSGSAVRGADFSAPTSVTIAPGETFATIVMDALADSTDEADEESAILTLGAPTEARLGVDTSFVLSIQDIDPPPSISFAQAGQVTREGAGVSVTLVAELSSASDREVKVLLSPTGTAARGTDWSVGNDWLVFPAGSRTATKTVQILNNGVVEFDEQVSFAMGPPTNAILGAVTSHALTIRDNDPEAAGLRETLQDAGVP